jgi:predicted enzyme related to lactoylglutathione lyase
MPTHPSPRFHEFVWHDLMSTDPPRSLGFYMELFGWRSEEIKVPMVGKITKMFAGDLAVGNVLPFDPKHGWPSHWVPYVLVEDVDLVCDGTKKLGGKVCFGAMDLPRVGRFAMIEDPTGALLHPIASTTRTGAPEPAPATTFVWDELRTADPDAARAFYKGLFGWGATRSGDFFVKGSRAVAGAKQAAASTTRPFWLAYVLVDDVEAASARAARLGAKTLDAPQDFPGGGRFAVHEDPGGATFGVASRPPT